MTAAAAAARPTFNMDVAVMRLINLAANKRAHRSRPIGSEDGRSIAQIFRMRDFPEPSPEWVAADAALKVFADELVEIGGMQLMADVYDEAVERHGYRAVSGVSASWNGCHGWYH